MEKEALKRIFEFLEEKEEHNMPFKLKLIFNKPLTKEDLNVKGNLNLEKSKITSLPKGLKVGGELNISGTKITSLPEGLEVGENLYIRYTELEQYLDNELREMVKPGFIKGKIIR